MAIRVEVTIRSLRPRIKWENTIEKIGQQRSKTKAEIKIMFRGR